MLIVCVSGPPVSAKISSPEYYYGLVRNPRFKNAGNFMRLSDFLTYAKGKPLSGILLSVEVRTSTISIFQFLLCQFVTKSVTLLLRLIVLFNPATELLPINE